MYKVKVLRTHDAVIIIDGKQFKKTCHPGEEVYRDKIFKEDIEMNLYRPYKSVIITPNEPVRTRQRVENNLSVIDLNQAITGIQDAIKYASDVLTKLQNTVNIPIENKPVEPVKQIEKPKEENIAGITDDMFVNENDVNIMPYTEENLQEHYRHIENIIRNNMIDADHPEEDIISLSITKPHLPYFAEANRKNETLVIGEETFQEIDIDKQIGDDNKDIQKNPVIETSVDKNGKFDTIKALQNFGVTIDGEV